MISLSLIKDFKKTSSYWDEDTILLISLDITDSASGSFEEEELIPEKLYIITLTVSGTTATGVSLTLLPGYTWFGYAGAQPADIATALGNLGVTPANGDTLTDENGNTATYNGSWSGTLTTLQPGHGYVYLRQ